MAEPQTAPGTDTLPPLAISGWAARQERPVPGEAIAFLESHPFLLPVLDDARLAIPSFLPSATLRYEVFEDPEDGVTRKLVLVIQTTGDPDVLVDQYFRLIEEWGDTQPLEAWENMIVTVG